MTEEHLFGHFCEVLTYQAIIYKTNLKNHAKLLKLTQMPEIWRRATVTTGEFWELFSESIVTENTEVQLLITASLPVH